jgi:hypothetical protein
MLTGCVPSLLLALVASACASEAPECAPFVTSSPPPCTAAEDVVLLLDDSTSLDDEQSTIDAWASTLIQSYSFDTSSASPARVGVVRFGGGLGWTTTESTIVVSALTTDSAALLSLVGAAHSSIGTQTCISCAIEVAETLFDQPGRKKILILISDGVQTSGGGNTKATATAI